MRKTHDPVAKAWRHAWSLSGRAYSTSVGASTRELLMKAWLAGYRAARRRGKR